MEINNIDPTITISSTEINQFNVDLSEQTLNKCSSGFNNFPFLTCNVIFVI